MQSAQSRSPDRRRCEAVGFSRTAASWGSPASGRGLGERFFERCQAWAFVFVSSFPGELMITPKSAWPFYLSATPGGVQKEMLYCPLTRVEESWSKSTAGASSSQKEPGFFQPNPQSFNPGIWFFFGYKTIAATSSINDPFRMEPEYLI